MAKRRRDSDADDFDAIAATTPEYNTVFLDTSLDTRLAMLVCNSDTVSDLKKRIALEHMQCFPDIGEIRIHSLKVKRRGNFYHLSDGMLVWSVFHNVKGSWFLSVDASSTSVGQLSQNPSELGTGNGVKMDTMNVDDNSRLLLPGVNQIQALPMSLDHGVIEKNIVPEIVVGFKDEKSMEQTVYLQSNNHENDLETDIRAKKKRKLRHTGDGHALIHASGEDESIPEVIGAVKEGPEGTVLDEQQGKHMPEVAAKVSGMANDTSDIGNRVAIEQTSAPATGEKSIIGIVGNSESSERKEEETIVENMVPEIQVASKMESNVPSENSGRVSVKIPDLSSQLMDASGATIDANSDGNKKKKRRKPKTPAKIQDTMEMEQSGKVESIKHSTKSHKSEEKDVGIGLSENHDHEVIKPSNNKELDHADPDLAKKETSNLLNFLDANAVTEPEISSVSKKKEKETEKKRKKEKTRKKPANTNLEKSGIKRTEHGVSHTSGLLGPSTNHILEETDKEENIHTEKEVRTKLLDISAVDASEKTQTANRNEEDLVKLPQSSAGNGDADFPSAENEKQIVELNKVAKDGRSTEDKNKKDKKKKKKKHPSASDIQENMLVKDQNVGIEVITTVPNSASSVNPDQEGRKILTSLVMTREDEEKTDEMHENAVSTNDPAKTCENKGEGINFMQYFLPDQHQEIVDSSDKVKTATKSNKEKKVRKKAKEDGLPSISISTELQNPVKSYENNETPKKPRVRKDVANKQGDSVQNSDWDEIIPNAFNKHSRVSVNGVKDASPNDMAGTAIQKTKENFPGKRGNKWSQSGLNSTNKMETRTPQTKSLLSKSGSIFLESSDESSGEENGTVHSGAKTRTPSDSSEGESDLSEDSSRNGSSDAKGRSAGGKNVSKLDSLSGSRDMTMDMILRSSKRFQKAKLQASQNEAELEPVEFVPESEPV